MFPVKPRRLLTAKEKKRDGRGAFQAARRAVLKGMPRGDTAHDSQRTTAPNFLRARGSLKPDWVERWIIDQQAITQGTSMPPGFFRQENSQWVFSGPNPSVVRGYDKKNHTSCLVDYILQLNPGGEGGGQEHRWTRANGEHRHVVSVKTASDAKSRTQKVESVSGFQTLEEVEQYEKKTHTDNFRYY